MNCYIHGNGTFDLKLHAIVVWGGGNLYNLGEMEREMTLYKTTKKFFSTYSVLDKSVYHLIVAISVKLSNHSRCNLDASVNDALVISWSGKWNPVLTRWLLTLLLICDLFVVCIIRINQSECLPLLSHQGSINQCSPLSSHNTHLWPYY